MERAIEWALKGAGVHTEVTSEFMNEIGALGVVRREEIGLAIHDAGDAEVAGVMPADGFAPSLYTDTLAGMVAAARNGEDPAEVTSLTAWAMARALDDTGSAA